MKNNTTPACYNSFSCIGAILIIMFVLGSIIWDILFIKPAMRQSIDEIRIEVKDIQLEYDTQLTTYEPFKTNILTVNEDVKLRGIANIKDELDLKTQITQVTNFIGGLGQVASAINVIQGLGNIWDDDSISEGEKILKTIETLAMAIPLVISGFSAMKASIGPALLPLVAGLKGMTVAELEAATAGTTMWTAVLGPIALIIAGIAAVGLAVYGLVKAFNAESDAAKEARENARHKHMMI